MTSFDTDIKKYTEKIHLKASERHELRERVFAYMEYHPLPKSAVDLATLKEEHIVSSPFVTIHFTSFYKRTLSGVAVLLLVIAPFIAEKSVPGDALYLVKTGINEPIQSQLATTPYEKIEFKTKLMERRIAEARVLATEGKLTEEVRQVIAETVKTHTSQVKQEIADLRVTDADGAAIASIAFNASLEVQSAMIEATVAQATGTAPMDSILVAVKEAHKDVVRTQQEETAPTYEALIAQVERETTRAYELFTSVKVSATEEEITDIDRRLNDINRLTLEGKERVNTDVEKASNDLIKTLSATQKLIAFLTDIDVRETVALQNIVPVILSDEERITIVRGEIETLGTTLKEEVAARLASSTDAGVVEKATLGLITIDELVLRATVALEVDDISLAEDAITEARALMTDIDMMTQVEIEEGAGGSFTEEGGTPEEDMSSGEISGGTENEEGVATTTETVGEVVETTVE